MMCDERLDWVGLGVGFVWRIWSSLLHGCFSGIMRGGAAGRLMENVILALHLLLTILNGHLVTRISRIH
jgi:hypothetical protein